MQNLPKVRKEAQYVLSDRQGELNEEEKYREIQSSSSDTGHRLNNLWNFSHISFPRQNITLTGSMLFVNIRKHDSLCTLWLKTGWVWQRTSCIGVSELDWVRLSCASQRLGQLLPVVTIPVVTIQSDCCDTVTLNFVKNKKLPKCIYLVA